jgi:hypothetical protein
MDRFGSHFDDFVSEKEHHEYEIQRLKDLEKLPEAHTMIDGSIIYELPRKFRSGQWTQR